jgi:hypothetical protein
VPAAAAPVTTLPAGCKPTPNPPPTEYGFVARATKGTVTGPRLSATGIDMSVCGVITVVNAAPGSGCQHVQAQLRVPSDGVVVNAIDTRLTLVPGQRPRVPVQLHASPVRQGLTCADSAGGFKISLAVTLRVGAGLFGLQCRIPLSGTLTTVVKGPLLTPPYHSSQVLSGSFRSSAVANNDRYCPGQLPAKINRIAGLPSKGYQVRLPTQLAVYKTKPR